MTDFSESPNIWIPLSDGRRLAAKHWLPDSAQSVPVPAILEYLPYRKRDGTAARDESNYPVFAAAGYAGVRVDTAGQGDSDGEFIDEYSEQELSDGEEVIAWIAAQDWCSGNVGMMGISWGGFNSLQLAARQPPALKAVISLSSVVDRYNEDIHHKGGCQLYSNFSWSNVMFCYASRPPDPEVRSDWREMWLHRLETMPLPLETWLTHQRRDEYWKHGSVSEDYSRCTIPTLIIGGWADLYVNAPVSAIENFSGPCKAIIGPWVHLYPHYALPEPRMDFHTEALEWWDCWLKEESNNADHKPAYRSFINENTRGTSFRQVEAGRWIEEAQWPSAKTGMLTLHPHPHGQLLTTPSPASTESICSTQDCGTTCGEIFRLQPDSDLPGDQRIDDAGSICFDTDPLAEAQEFLGAPVISLDVAINKPLGNLIVRLMDVHPDGMSYRISWGALNLSHRQSNSDPMPMQPGQFESITLQLDQFGYRLLPGHKLRLALSTAYWPAIQPPPEAVTATIKLNSTTLQLPTRPGGDSSIVKEPENPEPFPAYPQHKPSQARRWVERNLQSLTTNYCIYEDTGETEMPAHGLRTQHVRDERWTVSRDDPLTASAEGKHIACVSRGNWSVRTECQTSTLR